MYGRPSNFPYLTHTEDGRVSLDLGGPCLRATAHESLLIGDVVFWTLGGRVGKSLESSLYMARFAGVVVGGTLTDMTAAAGETQSFQDAASAKGEDVLIQYRGIVKAPADATTVIRFGDPITPGRTTSGRIRTDQVHSAAITVPGLVTGTVSNLVAKAVNATQTVVSGIGGTTTAANLAQAALAGTVTNGKFNVFMLRVAADGTTVTSAMGTEGATLNDVVLPAGVPTVACIGCIIINPTGVGNFVGATTALDDVTVIPNAKYVDFPRNRLALGYALQAGTPAAADAIKILLI